MSSPVMRSAPFKVLALLSALSVLVALVIHAGCSKPAPATSDRSIAATAQVAPAGSGSAPAEVAAQPSASAAQATDEKNQVAPPPPDLESLGASTGFMGASKSGAIVHGSDFGKARTEAGVPLPQAPSQNAAPRPGNR